MTRRNWLLLVIVVVAIGAAAVLSFTRQQQAAQQKTDPAAYKTWFVENYCLKQANDAAVQQGAAFNEEQKRVLQQVCGCGADRTLQKFTPAEIVAFQANPGEPTMLSRIKEIMQACATETNMPATNP